MFCVTSPTKQAASGTGFELVFKFECDAVGLVLTWNVEEVTAHNCKIEILGAHTIYLFFCDVTPKSPPPRHPRTRPSPCL